MEDRNTQGDIAFTLFMRGIGGGLLGGLLMMSYAMLSRRLLDGDIWLPLRSIAATFLGDRGVSDPGFAVEGAVLGAVIHATNAVLFGMILAGFTIAFTVLVPIPQRLAIPVILVGAQVYALTLMVTMQRVVIPLADPAFAAHAPSQARFTVEHLIYGLAVGLMLAYAWRLPRPAHSLPAVRTVPARA